MHQDVEVLPVEDERVVLDEAFNFDIPCEGPQADPNKLGDCTAVAKWIGLKPCGHHRLLCGDCKEYFLNRIALFVHFTCGVCGQGEATFYGFELINRARI